MTQRAVVRLKRLHLGFAATLTLGALSAPLRDALAQAPLPLAATPTPPPDFRANMTAAPAPRADPFTLAERLKQMGMTQADVDALAKRTNVPALAPVPGDPPEEAARKVSLSSAPAVPRQAPTLTEILNSVRATPEGRASIEAARRAGATIPPAGEESAGAAVQADSREGTHGPSASGRVASAAPLAWSLRATTAAPHLCSGTTNCIDIRGHYSVSSSWDPDYWWLYAAPRLNGSNGPVTPINSVEFLAPYIILSVTVPTTGSYLVNFEASGGTAVIKKYVGGTSDLLLTPTPISTSVGGVASHGVVVVLAAGQHYFYFVPALTPTMFRYFHAASVQLLSN